MQEGCFHGETCHQRLRSEAATLGGNGAGWAAQAHPVKEAEVCCWAWTQVVLEETKLAKAKGPATSFLFTLIFPRTIC